jgi:hypothetical protein
MPRSDSVFRLVGRALPPLNPGNRGGKRIGQLLHQPACGHLVAEIGLPKAATRRSGRRTAPGRAKGRAGKAAPNAAFAIAKAATCQRTNAVAKQSMSERVIVRR